jgi:hypothetical protein
MNDSAVQEFMQITDVQKKNSSTQKTINAKKDAAKEVIIESLQKSGEEYIQVGDSNFLVLVKKSSKQSYTSEFLSVLYRAFSMSKVNRQVDETEANAFADFCEEQAKRLGSTKIDLVPSKSRPFSHILENQ